MSEACSYSYCNEKSFEADDPEEAIIAAINAALEYLVKHNLTKYDEYTKTST